MRSTSSSRPPNTLPHAAGGDDALRGPLLDQVYAMAGPRAAAPTSQSTVIDSIRRPSRSGAGAQPAQHQPLGTGPERHQRDELAPVDVDRQVALGRNRDLARLAGFVSAPWRWRSAAGGLGQTRQARPRGDGCARGLPIQGFSRLPAGGRRSGG